jgi:hypothetical protein
MGQEVELVDKENVMNTKVIVAMVALVSLAAAIASPALAQRAAPRSNSGDYYGYSQSQGRQPHSSNPSNDVYVNGQYVGSDPDPNIRAQLQRNYGNQGRW